MRLLLIILLALPQAAKKPQHPNFRGPVSMPNVDPDSGPKREVSGHIKVPKDGQAVIPLDPEFGGYVIPPTCDFGGATLPGELPTFSKKLDFVFLKAKPRKTLHYHCVGLVREAL